MKTLVVYYSRTDTTKKVAEYFREKLNADIQQIIDTKDRSWAIWYIMAGKDAKMKKTTIIKDLSVNVADYDLILIGTPVWAWTVSSPIRTFLENYKSEIKWDIVFFCTMWANGDKWAFEEMSSILERQPKETISFLTKDVLNKAFICNADLLLEGIK